MSATEEYIKAQKLALKELPLNPAADGKSYLPVLDDILKKETVETEEKLGLEYVPLEQIIGTKSKGRTTAFAPNFMPLLEYTSEFGMKWIALCEAHIEEGIRDPITAYEYMNRYYVVEGNKRVSVLKYFNAANVAAYVTRIVPKRTEEPENVIYYEYMAFHKYSHINYIQFSQKGSYAKLLAAVGKLPEEEWTDEEQTDLHSAYTRFCKAFASRKKNTKLNITAGDAFLAFITIYGYDNILDKLPSEIKEDIPKIWEEFLLLTEEQAVELLMSPTRASEPKAPTLIGNIFTSSRKKIGFVHCKTAETSSWTYSHDLGRMYLEQAFPNEVETCMADNATPDNAEDIMEKLIEQGCSILFTTAPELVGPSLKIAVEHPDVKVLNCSLNMSHRYIRTYYARMYEAKFISGAIAGALTDTDNIGYIASYPIYGMAANINAFALGAKMTNPRATVHLAWSCLKDSNIYEKFHDKHISHISEQDMITPNMHTRAYGLIRFEADGELKNVASTLWDWGKLYERIVQTILNGAWKKESASDTPKALNYWWGMSSDVIDVVLSREVPPDIRRLVRLLKQAISKGDFNPFSGILIDQNGEYVSDSEDSLLSPEDIIKMNWLNENVVGHIPKRDELLESTLHLIELQGILE